jgi:tRNA threonylcarbamoyladenosine biosynthesis protein TsaB
MKILGIESSSLVASVAIVTDDILTAEYTVNYKKTHSQTLLPMLDEIVRMTETDLESIDAIAVSAGPGSFTGLRIGAATAKGLGLALSKPLIAVSTLEATACNLFGESALICPIMDARRSQVYNGLYRFEKELETIVPARALSVEELIEELNAGNEKTVFLGDGVPVYGEIIRKKMQVQFDFAPANQNRQRASSVAVLGEKYFREGKTVDPDVFTPVYLRKSQAEREREETGKI